jgi:hypothetical protein
MPMQQTEIAELFGPILQQGTRRRRLADYAAVMLLLFIGALWGYNTWLTGHVPKIDSITLVPNSIVIHGPADRIAAGGRLEFCPGDTMTVQFDLVFEGEGSVYADDAVHHANHTVKFSDLWRDTVRSGTRTYQDPWLIPAQPETAIDGKREWVAGEYERTISVAASNIYISRYVPPATFTVNFRISQDCEK